jgi:hypothetical protein
MYPQLENSNPEAIRRIQAIAAADPAFLIAQTARLLEVAKYNIYALDPDDIIHLISDFRRVSLAPLASLPLGELANELAEHITDPRLAAEIAEFEAIEATLLVVALDCFFADECNHPGRPVNGGQPWECMPSDRSLRPRRPSPRDREPATADLS